MGIASAIGIALKTAELFEDKEKQFQSTLQVLASSIDARDPLTAGHSEKVTEYAVAICRLLYLDKDYTETVRLASLFHDYGKIGVPDSVLKKKDRFQVMSIFLFKVMLSGQGKSLRKLILRGFTRMFQESPDLIMKRWMEADIPGD